jgi:hypothetical protein
MYQKAKFFATIIIISILSLGSASAQESIGDRIAEIYVDSIISPSARMEIERLINNSQATVDYQTRPDVVEERIRGGIGKERLDKMLESDRNRKCDQSGLCN